MSALPPWTFPITLSAVLLVPLGGIPSSPGAGPVPQAPFWSPAGTSQEPLAEVVAALGDSNSKRADQAQRTLAALTDPGRRAQATSLLSADLVSQSLTVRRARAELLADLATPVELAAIRGLALDPDPGVRGSLLRWLGRPDFSGEGIVQRAELLGDRARRDPAAALRRRAIEVLGSLDHPAAVTELGRLIAELPAPDRSLAATSLPSTPRSAELIRRLVVEGFAPERPAERTPDDVLAAVLPLHGRLLADATAGAERPADRAPLILGVRHPSPAVRRATAAAFEALLGRLREMGEGERALRVLQGLASQGLDRRIVHYHRARLAFFPAADPATALESARAMRGATGVAAGGAQLAALASSATEARLWLFRSLYLEGMAELCLGQPGFGSERLRESARVLDATLAERGDLGDEAAQVDHVETLQQRALAEIGVVLSALVAGADPSDRSLLANVRLAHRLSLEAQGRSAQLGGQALAGWDTLLDSELSPYRLIFTGRAYPGLDVRRAVELQELLGRVLASVAPREMPGFVPVEGLSPALSDPLQDPRRLELLREVQFARLDGLTERIDELRARLTNRGGTGWEIPEAQLEELSTLQRRQQILENEIAEDRKQGWKNLLELRVPGSQALWLARDLRTEGRGPDSRRVARRMKQDLEAAGISNWWYYQGMQLLVRADLVIGSAYTDEDEPVRAEEALLVAVARLESIERRLEEAGATQRDLEPYRLLRSNALVSLAVNSNVKLGRTEEADQYYEQAYELRQDEFMRVLLACYRARSGRDREARDLLREVRAGPQTYYNIACTYALLGETARALDYLELEFEENHPSEASRRRQQAWAAGDPDLANLRDDPRFRLLTGQ